MVIAPISRFFTRAIIESDDQKRQRLTQEMHQAVLAVTAFSILYRSSRKSTSGIDRIYRDLMEQGEFKTEDGQKIYTIPPLCRRPKKAGSVGSVTLPNLKRFLWNSLKIEGRIENLSQYINKAKNIPIYDESTPLTRFLLLLAYHDSVEDSKNPGLIKDVTPNSLNLLSKSLWSQQGVLSVEHIAPRHPDKGWINQFYDEDQATHSLGNLTLLPPIENSVFSNRAWNVNRELFKAISQKDPDKRDKLLKNLEDIDVDLSKRAREIIEDAEYRPLVSDLASYNGKWTVKFVEQRSLHLYGRVWNRNVNWLKT